MLTQNESNNLVLPLRHLRDPLDSFQVDREVKEIKERLAQFPILSGTINPEGAVKSPPGGLFLRTGDIGELYFKKTGQGVTGWILIA